MKTLPAQASVNPADYKRTYRHVEVEVGTTLEDLLTPRFWAHHFTKMAVNDLIDVTTPDGSLDVQLRVVGKGVGFVEMRPRLVYVREAVEQAEEGPVPEVPEGYVVNHAPKTGWRVLTKEPHMEVSRNHKSRREATLAAVEHAAKAGRQVAA